MNKKIQIVLASLIGLLLLLPTNVMANDTRNREFNYTTMIRSSTLGTHYIHPYDTVKSNNDAKIFLETYQDSLVTLKIQKNKMETSYVTLNQYLPAEGFLVPNEGFGVPLNINLTNQQIGDTLYTTGYNLFKTGLSPNTHYYWFYTGYIKSSQFRELTSPNRRIYYKYFSKEINSDIGLRNDKTQMNDRIAIELVNGGTINLAEGFYTPADDPSIIVSSVTTNTATISWSTNNTNPSNTSYTLQYRRLTGTDINNEGHWGAWTIIPVGGSNNTTALAVTTSIFSPENTYQLRVRVNHIGGASYNVYSDYVVFSTTADPAVRAAQEAAIAAQAAKKAAEDTVQYTLDTKGVAEDIRNDTRHPEYGLEALYNKIDLSILPDIKKVSNPQGATLAINQKFDVKINATGIKENLRYRVICDKFDSGWQESNLITITKLYDSGVKTATILVSNNPIDPDNGAVAEDEFKFFSL